MVKPKGNIISEVVVVYIINKASRYKRIDIVFNVYRKPSIKAVMRERPGSGCHVDATPQTCLLTNWSEFLRNDNNKTALYHLVQTRLTSLVDPSLATVVVISLGAALSNQTLDVSELSSCNHEEANTRMFLQVKHAKSNAVIKTVDTNVVIISILL